MLSGNMNPIHLFLTLLIAASSPLAATSLLTTLKASSVMKDARKLIKKEDADQLKFAAFVEKNLAPYNLGIPSGQAKTSHLSSVKESLEKKNAQSMAASQARIAATPCTIQTFASYQLPSENSTEFVWQAARAYTALKNLAGKTLDQPTGKDAPRDVSQSLADKLTAAFAAYTAQESALYDKDAEAVRTAVITDIAFLENFFAHYPLPLNHVATIAATDESLTQKREALNAVLDIKGNSILEIVAECATKVLTNFTTTRVEKTDKGIERKESQTVMSSVLNCSMSELKDRYSKLLSSSFMGSIQKSLSTKAPSVPDTTNLAKIIQAFETYLEDARHALVATMLRISNPDLDLYTVEEQNMKEKGVVHNTALDSAYNELLCDDYELYMGSGITIARARCLAAETTALFKKIQGEWLELLHDAISLEAKQNNAFSAQDAKDAVERVIISPTPKPEGLKKFLNTSADLLKRTFDYTDESLKKKCTALAASTAERTNPDVADIKKFCDQIPEIHTTQEIADLKQALGRTYMIVAAYQKKGYSEKTYNEVLKAYVGEAPKVVAKAAAVEATVEAAETPADELEPWEEHYTPSKPTTKYQEITIGKSARTSSDSLPLITASQGNKQNNVSIEVMSETAQNPETLQEEDPDRPLITIKYEGQGGLYSLDNGTMVRFVDVSKKPLTDIQEVRSINDEEAEYIVSTPATGKKMYHPTGPVNDKTAGPKTFKVFQGTTSSEGTTLVYLARKESESKKKD